MNMLASPAPAASGPRLTRIRLALALAAGLGFLALLGPRPALAQYQWSDENGRRVYSDVPPAPGSRVSNLVRRGDKAREADHPAMVVVGNASDDAAGSRQPAAGGNDGADAGAATAAGQASAQPAQAARREPSMADREMAFRKRQAERAEAEQKQLAQVESARKTARACDDARANLRSLESGQRISRTNEDGERVFLTDEERESRLRELRSDIASGC